MNPGSRSPRLSGSVESGSRAPGEGRACPAEPARGRAGFSLSYPEFLFRFVFILQNVGHDVILRIELYCVQLFSVLKRKAELTNLNSASQLSEF